MSKIFRGQPKEEVNLEALLKLVAGYCEVVDEDALGKEILRQYDNISTLRFEESKLKEQQIKFVNNILTTTMPIVMKHK